MSGDSLFSSYQPSGHGATVPVEHLDYGFIEKCKDVKYLEKILRALQSGEEGIYPHLTEFCETHLQKLDPKSRALRKDSPVATAASLPKEEWSQIFDELREWQEVSKKVETSLQKQALFDHVMNDNIPPVRGSNCSVPIEASAQRKQKRSVKHSLPRDYREWDKFDVEKECERVDGDGQRDVPPIITKSKVKPDVDASLLTQQEKLLLANRERDKGNDAFRAKDYEEAVTYYSRSLSIIPTVAAYNNRAQAQIKIMHWQEALQDCQKVLELDTGNVKALMRRATAYYHMEKFQMAAEDLRIVLREEPQNTPAVKLLSEAEDKLAELSPDKQRKTKKIIIQEVNEDEDSTTSGTTAKEAANS